MQILRPRRLKWLRRSLSIGILTLSAYILSLINDHSYETLGSSIGYKLLLIICILLLMIVTYLFISLLIVDSRNSLKPTLEHLPSDAIVVTASDIQNMWALIEKNGERRLDLVVYFLVSNSSSHLRRVVSVNVLGESAYCDFLIRKQSSGIWGSNVDLISNETVQMMVNVFIKNAKIRPGKDFVYNFAVMDSRGYQAIVKDVRIMWDAKQSA